MSTDTILAVDLGRYKSVACLYTRSNREHTFHTLDTSPAELDQLLARHPGAVLVLVGCWAMLRTKQRSRTDPVPAASAPAGG